MVIIFLNIVLFYIILNSLHYSLSKIDNSLETLYFKKRLLVCLTWHLKIQNLLLYTKCFVKLVVFNQHIFEKTNFKRIVHVIAKELNLIIAQKAITQECTIKQVRRWVVSNWQKYSVDRCGVTGNKIFVLPFYRKEVLPINLFLVSRKLEDQQIAHQICLQIFFAINYLFVKNNSKYMYNSILDFSCAGWK